ncbi:hypothetical protein [Anaerosphaera multitolerans]|uniref:Uncharacterized protein n=1 Tax=Anaerosphaera multitolerans TaxID=2487351 RepID=A0A437S896_9FIRM|nr:hypothetical protein [Anaerosphaera multitolerans]RVU55306.1 hypothetical protein EF514_03275 [Anaerosphaera multitolerans]
MKIKKLKSKKEIFLILDDYVIKFIRGEEVREFNIPKNIITDGEIKDYHHIFYLLKKFLKVEEISLKTDIVVFFNSSKILTLNINLPKLQEREIESAVEYQLRISLSENYDNFYIRFNKFYNGENYNINVFLVPKLLIEEYLSIFKNLNLKISGLYYLNSVLAENMKCENIVLFSFNTLSILNQKENSFKIKNYFLNDYLSFLNNHNLEYYNALNILDGKYDNTSSEIKEKFKKFEILNRMERFSIVERDLAEGSILFEGNLITDKIKEDLQRNFDNRELYFNMDYETLKLNKDLNFFETKKSNKNKVDYKILFVVLAFLIFNFLVYKDLNYKVNMGKDEFESLKSEEINIDLKIKELDFNRIIEDNNKIKLNLEKERRLTEISNNLKMFEKIFLDMESKVNENVLFTDYIFENPNLYIMGLSKDLEVVNKILEEINYKSKIIENNSIDGIINFKILIELGAKS